MARRKVYWHIGPDDLGTDFVARALDGRRDELAAAGVLVPGATGTWELVGAELRRDHAVHGLTRAEVEGQLAGLVRRIWRHKGTSVLSTPALASATREQVALALDGLRGAELHVVLVVRDLTSQVYAGAQAALETGATTRPSTYAARVLDPAGVHPQAVAYRAGHDLPDVAHRWTRAVLPEHVHVIAGSDRALIWHELMDLVGAGVDLPDVGSDQLGPAQLDALREVVVALDDQLDARGRRTALRDGLSRDLLPAGAGRFDALETGSTVADWTDHVIRKGFDMRGTITEDTTAAPTEPVTTEESLTLALADALVELARLRQAGEELAEENARLDRKRRKHKRRLRELAQQGAA